MGVGGSGIYSATTSWALPHHLQCSLFLNEKWRGGPFPIPHPQQPGLQSICERLRATANGRGEWRHQLPPLLPPPPPLPSPRLRTPSLLRGSTPRPLPKPALPAAAAELSRGSTLPAAQRRLSGGRQAVAATAAARVRLCQLGARAAAPAVPPRAERLGAGLSPAGARAHKHPHTDIHARALTLTDARTGVREPRLDGGVQER